MPKFLVEKLQREYPDNPGAVYGTLNAIGAMHGNKETAKGRAMQAKHDRDARNPDETNRGVARASRKGFRFPGGAKPSLGQIIGVKSGLKTGLRTGLETRYAQNT
jgi:hypothetical protein